MACKYKFEILLRFQRYNIVFFCQVYFTVKIDGIKIRSVENKDPRTFKNVQIFAGDNFYNPAGATYKNLEYENLPGNYLMILCFDKVRFN